MYLDAIMQAHSKPVQQPKKPANAPFFLPTVAGLHSEPLFDPSIANGWLSFITEVGARTFRHVVNLCSRHKSQPTRPYSCPLLLVCSASPALANPLPMAGFLSSQGLCVHAGTQQACAAAQEASQCALLLAHSGWPAQRAPL